MYNIQVENAVYSRLKIRTKFSGGESALLNFKNGANNGKRQNKS